jgi:hypothetical protein
MIHYIVKSTIEITTVKTTYKSLNTACMDIDQFIIQSSQVKAPMLSSETNWRIKYINSDDNVTGVTTLLTMYFLAGICF